MYNIRCFLCFFFIGCFSILLHAQQTEDGTRNIGFGFPCDKIELHPSKNDFGFFPIINSGKILISTEHDDVYHTPYQTEDGKVNITVFLPSEQEGTTVFFKLAIGDPPLDPDDKSPYELSSNPLGCANDVENTDLSDNRDLVIREGMLSANSAVAMVPSGSSRAEATVVLTITNQYAGDNYQVKASLDPSFSFGVETTPVLTAWKRMYLEIDRMYTKGATVRADKTLDFDSGNPNDRALTVDNTNDFVAGQKIYIFSPDGALNLECEVETLNTPIGNIRVTGATGSYNIKVDDGLRIDGQDETYSLDIPFSGPGSLNNTSVQQAFGVLSNGLDGGAFVEFVEAPTGNQNIPKITTFINGDDFAFYSQSWISTIDKKNRVQIISGRELNTPFGFPRGTFVLGNDVNVLGVFDNAFTGFSNGIDDAKMETLAHELGHKFGIGLNTFPHIHDTSSPPSNQLYESHDCKDRGVMTYNRNFDDGGVAEFYIECLYFLRDQTDPIE